MLAADWLWAFPGRPPSVGAGLGKGSAASSTAAWASTPVLGQVPVPERTRASPGSPIQRWWRGANPPLGGWGDKVSGMVLKSVMGRRRSRHHGPLRAESMVAAGGPEQMCPRHRELCLGGPCWGQRDRSSRRCAGPLGLRRPQGRRPGRGPTPPWLEE